MRGRDDDFFCVVLFQFFELMDRAWGRSDPYLGGAVPDGDVMNGLCSSCTQPVTCSHGVVVFSLPLLSTSEPIDFISFVTI